MRDVLVVLFWLWLLAALAVYAYRIYRRVTQGPKATRETAAAGRTGAADERPGGGGLRARLGQAPPPLPEGPVEPRLPRSLQDVPPPDTADGPTPGSALPGAPASPHTATTLADALHGITMPEALVPIVEPAEPGLADGRRARFGATGTNVPTVATALADELRRLGYSVDGLETITSARAGLTATRDDVSMAAQVTIDDDSGAVVVELVL